MPNVCVCVCSEVTMKRLLENMFCTDTPSDVVIVSGVSVLLTAIERRLQHTHTHVQIMRYPHSLLYAKLNHYFIAVLKMPCLNAVLYLDQRLSPAS